MHYRGAGRQASQRQEGCRFLAYDKSEACRYLGSDKTDKHAILKVERSKNNQPNGRTTPHRGIH